MKTDAILDPQQTYVRLGADGRATPLAGGERFWGLPAAQAERIGRDWLVLELLFETDWGTWEMHPNADEFVYLLSGAVDLLLETAAGVQRIALRGSGAVVVPRGVWHTAQVSAPSRMLHVTLGAGTQTRPVGARSAG
jgi:uncharacterized cupin superfamily protein